jgi:hypothetical protein
MTLKVRRAAQITLPRDIREAPRLEEGDYLEPARSCSGPSASPGANQPRNRKPQSWPL